MDDQKEQSISLEVARLTFDLVREGKEGPGQPQTLADVPRALEDLAEWAEVDWPDVRPIVASRADCVAFQLRQLLRSIEYPAGIEFGRNPAGFFGIMPPHGDIDLRDILRQARCVCDELAKAGGSAAGDRPAAEHVTPPHDRLRRLARLFSSIDTPRRETAHADDSTLLPEEGGEVPSPPESDGPSGIYKWRHNGIETGASMPPQRWKLAKYLHERIGQFVPFQNLLGAVFDDLADDQTIATEGRKAKAWFKERDIPLTISSSTTDRHIFMQAES